MPFYLLVLVALILLCGGGGYWGWGMPNGRPVGSVLGLIGLVLLIVLILILLGAVPTGPAPVYTTR